MKKIAIFGANGNLGRQAVTAFSQAGWQVIAVTRNGKYEHDEGVKAVAADAMVEAQVIRASEGCDFIFNGINPTYTQWPKLCMPVARNMMVAAKAHGAVHLFPGNVYNFGAQMPAILDENSPANADTVKGKIRVEMENLFQQSARQDGVQTIILRAGDFFGSQRSKGTWFDIAIVKKLEKDIFTYPGPMDTVHSWTYLPDLVTTFVKLAERADDMETFEVFHFEGHAVTGVQLKTAVETVTGRTLKHRSMPWPIMRFIGLFSPMLREVCEMEYLWRVAHRMDGSKLAKQIGEIPHTPLENAVSQALRELNF